MSELIKLTKFELISRIQSINRENNKLKTLLIRHQLLTNFYQKLFENCVQFKDLELNKNRKQIKNDLKSKQIKLLTQIQTIKECDKSVSIGLTKLQSQDKSIAHLFIEKSTQYEFETNSDEIENQIETKQNEVLVESEENMCQSINDCNDINVKTETLIDNTLNNDMIEDKTEEKLIPNESQNDSQLKTISIDLNTETNSSDNLINCVDKNEDKLVSNKIHKLFICDYCHKRYKHKKSFNNHMKQIHRYITTEVKTENHLKPKIESNDKDLKETKTSPKSNLIVCQFPECKLKFKNRTLFLRHNSIHNESRKICSECGLKFDDSNRLREHMIWHSNQSNHSNDTQLTSNQRDSPNCLNNGIQINDKCESISNDISCDNTIDLKHNSNERKLCCDFANCEYKTSNSYSLEVHQKRAHEKVYTML